MEGWCHHIRENLCCTHVHQTLGFHALLGLVDFFLLHLEDHLEQVPHGHHHLPGRLLRLDPEEPVPVLRRAVHVAEGSVVRHVLGYEADLVHRVVVQTVLRVAFLFKVQSNTVTYPCLLVSDLESVHRNLYVDPLLVFSTRLDGHLQLLQGILAHPVPSGLLHLQHSDQLPFEGLTFSNELLFVTASP